MHRRYRKSSHVRKSFGHRRGKRRQIKQQAESRVHELQLPLIWTPLSK
jgi:hypothetical protein